MGKLHTLRRAIEREPDKWFHISRFFGKTELRPHNAKFYGGQWIPNRNWMSPFAYRRFVKKVLLELGYGEDGSSPSPVNDSG